MTQAQGEEFVFSPERALGTTGWAPAPFPFGVLLGVALRPRRDAISPRRGLDVLAPSPGARLGGARWVWGGSGAGDGGGRSGGGSGTSGRSPKSVVRWAGECRREWGLPGRLHWGQAGLGSELRRKWPSGARCPVEPGPENRGPMVRKRPRLDPRAHPSDPAQKAASGPGVPVAVSPLAGVSEPLEWEGAPKQGSITCWPLAPPPLIEGSTPYSQNVEFPVFGPILFGARIAGSREALNPGVFQAPLFWRAHLSPSANSGLLISWLCWQGWQLSGTVLLPR